MCGDCSDLYGLVQSVGVGGGGEMDVWGEGGTEEGQLPFKAGDVISQHPHICSRMLTYQDAC